ncbi:MAG: DUF1801 domain-containing protein [Saprospiraceae bacterium]|nr:DUF1801 domain-containing protein [Saprospiraceae bacterium]
MQSKALTVEAYMKEIPKERYEAMEQLRKVIKKNLPKGFNEEMSYGGIGYVVPHNLYPPGYHCDPKLPLPFLGISSQKNFIGFYHMGIYASPELLKWFQNEYPKYCKSKLDMGKSCLRLKKMDDIPYKLIGELCTKMNPEDWIAQYEKVFNKK